MLRQIKSNFGKIVIFIGLFTLTLFALSIWQLQVLVNEGSEIADEQCLKVNPLIIARKNSYIKSLKIIESSGGAEEYWEETEKYLDYSQKYVDAQSEWLKKQRDFMSSNVFNTSVPSYIRRSAQYQYDSRAADVKSTMAVLRLFYTYDSLDTKEKNELVNEISVNVDKSVESDRKYFELLNNPQKPHELKEYFISIPKTKCPPENFRIPDVNDFFIPPHADPNKINT